MINKIKLLLIILIFNNKKFFFPLLKINFSLNDEPLIWNLTDKDITNSFTLTLLFKFTNFSDMENKFWSFGNYNLFFNYIKIFKKADEYGVIRYYLGLNNKINSNNIELIQNQYYFIIYEFEKIKNKFYYYIKSTLNYGISYNENNNIIINSQLLLENYISLESFLINLGSKQPEDLANFYFTFENLTIFNKKWNNYEKNNILKGGSNALIFLDFSNSLSYSQYFYNKIDKDFFGGINGDFLYVDEHDLFYEYIKISNTQIKKKWYIFNLNQYIKLPQEWLEFLNNFDINSYTVYLKITIHLNNSDINNSLNKSYKLYNRADKSGININLLKINENINNKFEFEINLIEDITTKENIISNDEILNFKYLILRYEKLYISNKFKIYLTFETENKFNWIFEQSTNNLNPTDEHYIGDYSTSTIYLISYILIELEEFMLGKGIFIENLFIDSKNIIYDNINLNCKNLNNNKINRNILYDNCIQRNEIQIIDSNCEYSIDSSCIFYIPDYNDDVLDVLNSVTKGLNIIKPYKQIFNRYPKLREVSNRKDTNEYLFTYSLMLITNNNIILEIDISKNNISSCIFEIEFDGNKIFNFFINKNNPNTKFSIEILVSRIYNNPTIKIINLSNSLEFTINSMTVVEVEFYIIDSIPEKFIGSNITNILLVNNKEYTQISLTSTNQRNLSSSSLKINCNKSCNDCDGPLNINCTNCKSGYKNYRNLGCIKENAKNCLNFSNNPSFCSNCKSGYKKLIIDSNRVKCLCHYLCKNCLNSNFNSCTECFSGLILYENNICKPLYKNLKCEPNFVFRIKNPLIISEKFDKCWKCNKGCYSCLINNLNYCNSCLYGYFLLNNECIRCNNDGQFINKNMKDTNNQNTCGLCHNTCKNCLNNLNNSCLNCQAGYYLTVVNKNEKICSLCNLTGYFIENNLCIKCNINCINCKNNANNCSECKNGYYLDNIKKDCILKCRNGTFLSGKKCLSCHKNCSNCYNYDEFSCLECKKDFYLYKNTCILCKEWNNIILEKNCYKCNVNCRTCYDINYNNCLSCNNNFSLVENSKICVKICPEKTYRIKINNLYYCRNCFKGCSNCLDHKQNSCLKCEKNYFYNKYNNTCKTICDKGFFYFGNNCEICDNKCSNCLNKNYCLKCKNSYYLKKNNSCTTCKEKGYFIKDDKCYKCSYNCLTCIDFDNCLNCDFEKNRIFNKKTNKYFCKPNCKFFLFFNKKINKCINCNECKICQIKNEYFCDKCLKCKNNCIYNFKFNETGLYLFNKEKNYNINLTKIIEDNKNLIRYSINYNLVYFFKIKNNFDSLKNIDINLSNKSILSSYNCTNKINNRLIKIKKNYEKICKINKINYDLNKNLLFFKFNFKIDIHKIRKYFNYRIKNGIIKYEIKNITNINENEIHFYFLPNYYKKLFNITFIFNNNIIKDLLCKKPNFIKINYLINSDRILYYESEINLNLKSLNSPLDKNNTISKSLENVKQLTTVTKNGILGSTFLSSIFSQFLNLLIRFFQIVYILDFITLLKLNWGEYVNTFISYFNIEFKLFIEFNEYLKIPLNNMEIKITKILSNNPKLKESEFIFLTNFNVEFIFLVFLFIGEIIFQIIYLIYNIIKKKKRDKINTKNKRVWKEINLQTAIFDSCKVKEINIKKEKILNNKIKKKFELKTKLDEEKKIKNKKYYLILTKKIILKIKSLRLTYIGTIFPNLISTILIYSEIFYNFDLYSFDDIKLLIIYLLYYLLFIIYCYEIITTLTHFKVYKKQKTDYEYRNDLFIFNNNYDGLHNYIILFTLIRDFLFILIGLIANLKVLFQVILFFIVQFIYVLILFFVKSKYDYKNIQIFKLQEILNLILIFNSLIWYFTKYEFFQFFFIFIFIFLLFISLLNLLYEIFSTIIWNIWFLYFKVKLILIKKLK